MNLKYILFFALLILIGCTKQKEDTTTLAADTTLSLETSSGEVAEHIIPDPTDPLLVEYKNFVWDLDKSNPYSVRTATEKYENLFRGKPKPLGDTAIYWFEKLYAAVTNNLNEHHLNNAERYDSLVMMDEEVKLSKFLTNYRDSLTANGHRITMEEGGSYIEQDRTFMKKAFYTHVSPAMVQYLTQVHTENEEGFGTDGGLIIEPETLATRIGWWEEFYKTNPGFIFQDGREWYATYINVLMTGTDNTPHYFDLRDGKKPALEEYYVKAYTHLFTAYPNAKITQQLRPYYKLLLDHDVSAAEKFRDDFLVR